MQDLQILSQSQYTMHNLPWRMVFCAEHPLALNFASFPDQLHKRVLTVGPRSGSGQYKALQGLFRQFRLRFRIPRTTFTQWLVSHDHRGRNTSCNTQRKQRQKLPESCPQGHPIHP